MAEQISHDVVKEAQSVGEFSPIDDTATSTSTPAGNGEAASATTNVNQKSSEVIPTTSTNATSKEAEKAYASHTPDKLEPASTAAPKDRLVNGDTGEQSASEEANSQQGQGDVSGGSDTDISRPGSVDPAKERPGGHLRSNSVKKPASFKSVSVTKNFLAKSAVSTPTTRPGEKPASPGQSNGPALQTAKPRLVAKSGSGLNMSRSSLSKVNGVGSGPDASKVWNKNQPIPPPPPKQFTDEELKQQYGIHMATRLQADDNGKEAKWADIDDDEDDWAPETVQWMDGTKSTVAAVEAEPPQPPPEEPKPVAKPEASVEPTQPVPIAAPSSQRPSSTGGSKTILKPGVHAQTGSKSGLVLKGQPEKPTLVAKPSAPSAVKSPWATLPPVEKVPPVQINPPPQHAPPRFPQRDPYAADAPHHSLAAKEIAPDDFNRSWRDDRGSRELFNSHSGRYEPVNDTRRGSLRDGYRNQPAVLQRPPHDGPAEPSAAFQTSRTSADAPAWGRRRNSSNVSGGSGRRMSMDRRGPEIPPTPLNIQRRGSHSINGNEGLSPGTPRHAFPAVPEQHGSSTQLSSPNLSVAQPTSPYGSVGSVGNRDSVESGPPVQVEDALEVQKRTMREKLDKARLAKQREREEEQKAEELKRERLQKRIALIPEGENAQGKEQSSSRPERSPQKSKAVPAPVQSPPKPPVPTSEGEVAQYGMMKVHQPHPVKKPHSADMTTAKSLRPSEGAPKPSPSPVKLGSEVHSKGASPSNSDAFTDHSTNPAHSLSREGRHNKAPHNKIPHNRAPLEQSRSQQQLEQSEGEGRAHILKSTQPPQAAWAVTPSLPPQQSRPWVTSVWGPPQAKDRALGNGTFDSSFNRSQHSNTQQLTSAPNAGQAPSLGLNSQLKPSPSPQSHSSNPPFSQPTMFSKSETAPAQQAKVAPKPGPIAPPSDNKGGWANFAAAIKLDDQAMAVKALQDFERVGGETFRPEMRETYKDRHGRSQATLHNKVGGHPLPKSDITKPEGAQVIPELKPKDDYTKPATEANPPQPPIGQGAHLPSAGTGARASRFFPRPAEPAAQSVAASADADSPPPPETESHPAFTGNTHHPVVKMPKPSPRVKLPPAAVAEATAPTEAAVSMPSRTRLGLGARPLALNPEWQARFNSLLEKPGAAPAHAPAAKASPTIPAAVPVKGSALAVAASSKAPLEVRGNVAAATVSLPRKTFAEDGSSETTTRASAETTLLEDREFGSLPVVKPPKVPHLAANEAPAGFPPNRPNSKLHRPMDVTTKPVLNILDYEQTSDTIEMKIRLGNMVDPVTKTVAKKRMGGARKTTNQKGSKRSFTPSGANPNSTQNTRTRKPTSFQRENSNSSSAARSSGNNGWNSNRSTPPHNNSTWTRRAAPVH